MTASVGIIHVHSSYSHDGHDSLEALRDFAEAQGIGFIGLTDHAEDFDADRFSEFSARCRQVSDERIRILPGLEWRFSGYPGLHLLGLGIKQWIEPKTPAEFVSHTGGNAGLTIVAHPILPAYRVPDEVLAGIDAIEVWNGNYNTRYLPDPKAIKLYHDARLKRPGLVATVGPDQHDLHNDRRLRVQLSDADAEPLAALKSGRFANRGPYLGFDSAVSWTPVQLALLRALRVGFDTVERTQERLSRYLRSRARS
jgi:predicted metal-dependent phosphoesterase TrpH